jgi:prepilin signal peptidase PulO-like enzyme (type II secretory pathway)
MLLYLLIFILGLITGSFLNVVIIRLKEGESILKNRSHCLFCGRKLTWKELIPLFSFLFQKGKCLGCGKKISRQYPLVEFFTAVLFVLIFVRFFTPSLPGIILVCYLFAVTCFLIIIFVYDLKYYLVSDKLIYPVAILAVIWHLVVGWFLRSYTPQELLRPILGALIAGGLFLIIVLISKEKWMGWGDVKIAIFMGLLLGLYKVMLAILLAFCSGAIVSLVLVVLKKKKLKSEIPFGPFLAAATFIALIWGRIILDWYAQMCI